VCERPEKSLLVLTKAEDDGKFDGEVPVMQNLAEKRRSRFKIFDPIVNPYFTVDTVDEGDGL
jgi:hypothetical protein